MPRRKHWRKSDSKRRERSRTDESETTVTGKYTGSPGRNQARSPGRNQARGPGRNQARSPGRNQARSPGRNQARSPGRNQAGSPEHCSGKEVLEGTRQVVLKKAGIRSRKASTQQ